MFIKGNSISLRALEPSDAECLYEWENDLMLWNVSATQVPISKFLLEDYVNLTNNDIYASKQLRFIIQNNKTNLPVGAIDLFEFDPHHARCGIGIFIHQDFRKNNFGFESIESIKKYCFEILYLNQIYVHVAASNTASISLFEKAGFQKNGLKKNWNKTSIHTFEDVWFLQFINQRENI